MKKQLGALGMDERELLRQAAIVSSMTRGERENAESDECQPQKTRRGRVGHQRAGRQ